MADSKTVRVLGKVLIELNVGLNTYSEEFLVLDQMSTAILGNPFFIKIKLLLVRQRNYYTFQMLP